MTKLELIEKISEEFDGFCDSELIKVRYVRMILDKYAFEECDNDCGHCAYLECPKWERV